MSAGDKKHLQVKKEAPINEKRSGRPPRFAKREDVKGHGQKLKSSFVRSYEEITSAKSSFNNSCVVKIYFEDALDFSNLGVHGVDFISQEGSNLFVGFLDEDGLNTFRAHLDSMAQGDKLTYVQVLKAFESIGAWTEDDKKSWAIRTHGIPSGDFVLDVEVWPVGDFNSVKRRKYKQEIERFFLGLGIGVRDCVNLDSLLLYRVSLNAAAYAELLKSPDVRLVDLPPESGVTYEKLDIPLDNVQFPTATPPESAPKVCILDSGVNTSHPLLSPAIAESASFVQSGEVNDEAGHGTQVASIALYGDFEERIDSNYWAPEFWICNGRVLDENCEFDVETIEATLIKAVEYFVELGCKIFNLSVGNANAPYDGKHIRGIAYVLDTLSRKYDILFVVSSGNFNGSDVPPVPEKSWRDEYPSYLIHDVNRIIDPAPSLNSITVGGLAKYNATQEATSRPDEISHLAAASFNQPSPFTRRGPSVKGALKPEVVAYAGNYACPMRFEDKQWQAISRGMGVLACNPFYVGRTLLVESSGTSFSAPYVTHLAARLLKEYPDASANMLRCLLLSQTLEVAECRSTFDERLRESYAEKYGARRLPHRDLAGYGVVDEDNLYRSSEDAVVLMAEDAIKDKTCQFFEIPIPDEYLRKGNASREIGVALAHMPAVKTTRIDYKATRLSFNLVCGASLEEVEKYYNKDYQRDYATQGDSVQDHRRSISGEARGRGTAQFSRWCFKRLDPAKKWFVVVTRQDAYGWGDNESDEEEKYAIVISVTDRENEQAQLYTQISQRINERNRSRINNM